MYSKWKGYSLHIVELLYIFDRNRHDIYTDFNLQVAMSLCLFKWKKSLMIDVLSKVAITVGKNIA